MSTTKFDQTTQLGAGVSVQLVLEGGSAVTDLGPETLQILETYVTTNIVSQVLDAPGFAFTGPVTTKVMLGSGETKYEAVITLNQTMATTPDGYEKDFVEHRMEHALEDVFLILVSVGCQLRINRLGPALGILIAGLDLMNDASPSDGAGSYGYL